MYQFLNYQSKLVHIPAQMEEILWWHIDDMLATPHTVMEDNVKNGVLFKTIKCLEMINRKPNLNEWQTTQRLRK